MKKITGVLVAIALAVPAIALADYSYPMIRAIELYKTVTLSDNTSLYRFSFSGDFHSEPLPDATTLNGRILDGRWTDDGNRFIVTAREHWAGDNDHEEYRRIVFVIQGVHPDNPYYSGYFVIDENTKIDKPDNMNF